jgi:hypothetical protein
MKWITREGVRVDRVASAWLLRRFVDPAAVFLFAPADGVLDRAKAEDATAFHVPGCDLGKRAGRTGFDAIIDHYGLEDAALHLMADVVRSAEGNGEAPEGPGMAAMSHGFAAMGLTDQEVLVQQLPAWEALYRYCQGRPGGPK